MSIRVECNSCHTQHAVHDRLMNRSIRCPSCDKSIVVADSIVDEVQAELVDDDVVEVEVIEADEAVEVEQVQEKLSPVGQTLAEDEIEEITFPTKELPKDDMDMTPMVDVTFLLLIFFMITASFSSEKVFEEPPPLSDKASSVKEEQEKLSDVVKVQVDEFNAYTVILPGGEDRQASSKQDLLLALDDARRELSTGSNDDAIRLEIEAHVDSIHAAVVAALDAGRDKGFSSFRVTAVEEFN